MPAKNWKLSPSDFAFLWEECKRCFYLKVAKDFSRPRPIMPKIFTVIDSEMTKCFAGKRTEEIVPAMSKGIVQFEQKWVESLPIKIENHSSTCFIRGRFDTVVKFDDGSYGVVDFKTSEVKSEHISLYGRQLHAYAYTLENAAPNKPALAPVSKLGLLVYEPAEFSHELKTGTSLAGQLAWIEILRDDSAFMEFLSDVLSVLEQESPPGGSPSCEWCQYRDTSRRTRL